MHASSSKSSSPSSQRDADFDALLHAATAEIPLHGSFQAEVWRRIATAQSATLSARLAQVLEGFFALLERPAAALVAVLAMVGAGAWLGIKDPPPNVSGKLAYVASVSPFADHQAGEQQ